MMEALPKLRESRQFPVTLLVCLLSFFFTFLWWSDVDISGLFANGNIRRGELWRLVSAVFVHGDILHIAFNLYWVWLFGSLLEKAYGSIRFIALFLFFAVGSSAWDYALASGGIGVSGVVYAFFGMLLLLKDDDRFIHALDKGTVALFTGWFIACIILGSGLIKTSGNQYVLGVFVVALIGAINAFPGLYKRYGTALNILFILAVSAMMNDGLNIANVAHGAGLLLGLLTGAALAGKGVVRPLAWVLAVSVCTGGVVASVYARPYINITKEAYRYEQYWCYHALKGNRKADAMRWCEQALLYDKGNFDNMLNMGLAYEISGDRTKAQAYYEKARAIDPQRFEKYDKPK